MYIIIYNTFIAFVTCIWIKECYFVKVNLTQYGDMFMITASRKLLYNAVVLDKKSKEKLRRLFGGRHAKWYGSHSTLAFKPESEPVNIGQTIEVEVIGYSSDDKAEAVVVKMDAESTNNIPHITLTTRTDVKPFYSNQLLSDGFIRLSGIKLSGVVTSVYAKD
jgi:hypothetical protein